MVQEIIEVLHNFENLNFDGTHGIKNNCATSLHNRRAKSFVFKKIEQSRFNKNLFTNPILIYFSVHCNFFYDREVVARKILTTTFSECFSSPFNRRLISDNQMRIIFPEISSSLGLKTVNFFPQQDANVINIFIDMIIAKVLTTLKSMCGADKLFRNAF